MATLKGRISLSLLASLLAAGSAVAVERADRADRAAATLLSKRAELGLDESHSFAARSTVNDEMGQTHVRFQQLFNNVKVWGGDVIVHMDGEGRLLPMTADHKTNIRINTTPSLSDSEALAVARGDMAIKADFSVAPSAELLVYPEMVYVPRPGRRAWDSEEAMNSDDFSLQVTRYTLAYHVHLEVENDLDGIRQMDYLVNAHTGAILKSWNTLHTTAATGTGNSQYNGVVTLNTNSTATGFEMRDMTRGAGGTFGNNVVTNSNHASTTSTATGAIYTDADNTWGDGANYVEGSSTTAANGQTAAVDAMFGMAKSWDYYKLVLGRNGIDGTGKATYSRVHVSNSYDNAFWSDSCFCMTYGDGSSFTTLTSIDVAGHEMSHGVCATTANLTYSGESGGLNESNSDIHGTMIEYYSRGAAGATTVPATGGNFNIGEQLSSTPLRYMQKPSLDGSSPDAWSSSLGSLDVHYSSGPSNRMFYFLSQGATTSGNGSTPLLPSGMTGIGNDHAARISFRALATYMTSSTNYAGARTAYINAAKDLYGAGSTAEQAVWNAFHGINVGAAWTSTTPTAPAITGQPANATVGVGATATFTVTATGTTLAYQWRKNGTNISGATAASYTTPATVIGDSGSTFSVVVSNSLGSVTSSNATLTVTSTPPGNVEVEPNNSSSAAQNVATSGTTINGKIASSTDVDWYKCTLGAGRTMVTTLTPNSTSDYDLYVYNSNVTQIGSSLKGTGLVDSVSVTNTGTSAFVRYAKVVYYSGATGTAGTYTIKLTF